MAEIEEKNNEMQSELKKIEEELELMAQKPLEEITEDDYSRCTQLVTKYKEVKDNIEQRKKSLELELNEKLAAIKKYTLVDRADIMSEEEEKTLRMKVEQLSGVINVMTSSDSAISKVTQLMEQYTKKKELEAKALEKARQEEKQRIKEQKEANYSEKIKGILLEKGDPVYVARRREHIHYNEYYPSEDKTENSYRIVPAKFEKLVEAGALHLLKVSTRSVAHPHDFHDIDYKGDKISYEFVPYEKCTLSEKQRIREKEQAVRAIRDGEEKKNDRKIKIKIPGAREEIPEVEIIATPRELAEAGVLYTDLEWEKAKRKDLAKEIAVAGKEAGVTQSEISGAKKVIERLTRVFTKGRKEGNRKEDDGRDDG